ncbi:HutD family protein [Rhizobium sp. CG5]|uniref:HutD/Ves family protein n=1 Tax=Rhizobium sp. CG5 TaxID=2726076 RepID=UPI002033EAC3|nr:HutD family protein [Rhizobium sp. CG5]MCM2476064.1 HutD family protein [Rhizobium sp. CG5]
MKVVRIADCKRMPWKNGGGETVEIAVSPTGSSVEDFDWRISMATVATDGPFSAFAGIDRTLTVLEGQGMTLEIAGMGMVHLGSTSDPMAFPGDVAVHATLSEGPIVDFNVMTRRNSRHRVVRGHLSDLLQPDTDADLRMFLALEPITLEMQQGPVSLGRYDMALCDRSDSPSLVNNESDGKIVLVQIWS